MLMGSSPLSRLRPVETQLPPICTRCVRLRSRKKGLASGWDRGGAGVEDGRCMSGALRTMSGMVGLSSRMTSSSSVRGSWGEPARSPLPSSMVFAVPPATMVPARLTPVCGDEAKAAAVEAVDQVVRHPAVGRQCVRQRAMARIEQHTPAMEEAAFQVQVEIGAGAGAASRNRPAFHFGELTDRLPDGPRLVCADQGAEYPRMRQPTGVSTASSE